MLYTIGITSQGEGSRANSKETIRVLKERINKISSFNIVKINTSLLKEEINKVRKVRLPNEPCFVHGDLDCRHLIFNGTKLKGIIDWGDIDITSRSVDLAVVWGFFPGECHNKFLEVWYGRFGYLGIRAVSCPIPCLFTLTFAADTNDEE